MSLLLHASLAGRSLVEIARDHGLVGAGGAGFPTWAKLSSPQPLLVVNAQESEPGFFVDKWLHHTQAPALLEVLAWLRTQGFAQSMIAAKQKDRAWFASMEGLAGVARGDAVVVDATGRNRPVPAEHATRVLFAYTDDRYAFGMETALLMIVAGTKVPQGDRPTQHGVVVLNSETLFNLHTALTTGGAVVDKYVHVFGATPRHTFVRVAVGTPVAVVLADAGIGLDEIAARGFVVVDGGPGWFSPVDPTQAVVTRRTNAVLVLDPAVVDVTKKDVFATATKPGYPLPAIVQTTSPSTLSTTTVRVPLIDNVALKSVSAAVPTVAVGDAVLRGQQIGCANTSAISVASHASIDGTVISVGDDGVMIRA